MHICSIFHSLTHFPHQSTQMVQVSKRLEPTMWHQVRSHLLEQDASLATLDVLELFAAWPIWKAMEIDGETMGS